MASHEPLVENEYRREKRTKSQGIWKLVSKFKKDSRQNAADFQHDEMISNKYI